MVAPLPLKAVTKAASLVPSAGELIFVGSDILFSQSLRADDLPY